MPFAFGSDYVTSDVDTMPQHVQHIRYCILEFTKQGMRANSTPDTLVRISMSKQWSI